MAEPGDDLREIRAWLMAHAVEAQREVDDLSRRLIVEYRDREGGSALSAAMAVGIALESISGSVRGLINKMLAGLQPDAQVHVARVLDKMRESVAAGVEGALERAAEDRKRRN